MTTKEQLKHLFSKDFLKIPVNVDDYDFEQGDNDELDSGGVWDLSRHLAEYLLDLIYCCENVDDRTLDDTKDRISELLYNLIKY